MPPRVGEKGNRAAAHIGEVILRCINSNPIAQDRDAAGEQGIGPRILSPSLSFLVILPAIPTEDKSPALVVDVRIGAECADDRTLSVHVQGEANMSARPGEGRAQDFVQDPQGTSTSEHVNRARLGSVAIVSRGSDQNPIAFDRDRGPERISRMSGQPIQRSSLNLGVSAALIDVRLPHHRGLARSSHDEHFPGQVHLPAEPLIGLALDRYDFGLSFARETRIHQILRPGLRTCSILQGSTREVQSLRGTDGVSDPMYRSRIGSVPFFAGEGVRNYEATPMRNAKGW
jgi:hypothetical protein